MNGFRTPFITGHSTLLCALALALAGCGGGGGGSADTTAPTVVSVTPAADATDVAVNTTVSVTFSEAVDCATLTTNSFQLTDGTNAVSGSVACNGSNATFTPAADLAGNTAHTATITSAAKDAAGNALAADYAWSFTTGTAPDATAPTVASVTPAANATGVAIDTAITVTFNEAMNCTTLTTSSFTLKDASAHAVSGSVACNDTVATFTPASSLTDGIQYSATVTTGAKDAAGNALAADYVWHFTTRARAWGAATPLDSTRAFEVDMAIDADGNGLAVWKGVAGFDSHIYAQRYDAVTGWAATAEILDTGTVGSHPQIAFLPDGKAIAVWSENPAPPGGQLTVNIYDPVSGWGAPTALGDGFNYGSTIVADSQGHATVVWSEADGVWTSRYSAGSWSAPYQLSSDPYAGGAEIAVDAAGNVMAVWLQDIMGDTTLWYSRYDAAGNTWPAAQLFDSVASGSSTDQSIGVDANGNYIVVWRQTTMSDDNVYWRRWSAASSTWTAAVRLNGAGTFGYSPLLAVSANGDAVAAWEEWDGSNDNIAATVYTSGTGWAAPQHIDSPTNDTATAAVTIDASGNAVAMWLWYDPVSGNATGLWANRYTAAAGWGAAAALTETLVAGDAPLLRTDPQGDVTAIWLDDNVPSTARFE